MKRKHLLTTILGFVISVVLFYFSLRGIRFQEILTILRNAHYTYLVAPLLFIILAVVLCAFRWSRISGSNVGFATSFVALMIGLFANNVLPARLGELARGYVLARKAGLSLTYSVSTVFLDRFFDLAGLLLLTFVFFPKQTLPHRVSQGIYMLVGFLVLCIVLIFLLSREKLADRLTGKLTGMKRPSMARLGRRISEVQENLKRINSPANIIYLVLISSATWLSMAVALYATGLILGIPIRFIYIPFVCALLNLGLTIPSSPGYVGVYQFLLVYLLSIFEVPKHEAFTISIVYHALWYVPYNILGFAFLIKEHMGIREISTLEEE